MVQQQPLGAIMVSKEIEAQLSKELLKHIDIPAMARRLAPSIEKELESGMMRAIKEIYWADEAQSIVDNMDYDPICKALVKRIALSIFPETKKPAAKK